MGPARLLSFGSDGSALPEAGGILGQGRGVHFLSHPEVIDSVKSYPFVSVTSGFYHHVALTEEGRAFSFGMNSHGCLGFEDGLSCFSPKPIRSLTDVICSCAGETHSLFLTKDRRVYMCGRLFDGKDLSSSDADKNVPSEIESLRDKNITKIVSGAHFSIAMSEEGSCFAWGNNTDGQLGLGSIVRFVPPESPEPISFGGLLVPQDLCCQSRGVVALTANGKVFVWGFNQGGRLGLGAETEKTIFVPQELSFPLASTERIVSLGGGTNFSLCLTSQGRVFCFGANQFGQLGLGHRSRVDVPTLVEPEGGARIEKVFRGFGFHCFVQFVEDNSVFSWGRNEYGQLGHGDTRDRIVPHRVTALGGKAVGALCTGLYSTVTVATSKGT